jgi:hypothetical protein
MQPEEIRQNGDEPLEPDALSIERGWGRGGSLEPQQPPRDGSPKLRRGALRRFAHALSKSPIGGGVLCVAVFGVVVRSSVWAAVVGAGAGYSAYYLLTRHSRREWERSDTGRSA